MANVIVKLQNGKNYTLDQQAFDNLQKKGVYARIVEAPTKPDIVNAKIEAKKDKQE